MAARIDSAGTLLYRPGADGWEVLLVRPSGPAARYGWSIPKGIPDPGETLEAAARRETMEETGCTAGPLEYLGFCDYRKSPKRVHCFVGPAKNESAHPASWEVDRAQFVSLDEAERKLHQDQRALVTQLRARLESKER